MRTRSLATASRPTPRRKKCSKPWSVGILRVAYTARLHRDAKHLKKRRYDLEQLETLIDLVAQNTPETLEKLRRRHNMHDFKDERPGNRERYA